MEKMDIYITGVGGQGIGLLSETIARSADYAGYKVIGTDTHGLAQRGGMVSSHIRLGETGGSCLIRKRAADMVIGMENHESLRALINYLKFNGMLVYFNTILQPLSVRLGEMEQISEKDLIAEANKLEAKIYSAEYSRMDDARMQNILLLGTIAKNNLIKGIGADMYKKALADLLPEKSLARNLELFDQVCNLS